MITPYFLVVLKFLLQLKGKYAESSETYEIDNKNKEFYC